MPTQVLINIDGAAVSLVALGSPKTFILAEGDDPALIVDLEASADAGATFAPFGMMYAAGGSEFDSEIVCTHVRAVTRSGDPTNADLRVSADAPAVTAQVLAIDGAAVDLTTQGPRRSVVLTGQGDDSFVTIEGSQDNAAFAPIESMQGNGVANFYSETRYLRAVRRSGTAAGVCAVATRDAALDMAVSGDLSGTLPSPGIADPLPNTTNPRNIRVATSAADTAGVPMNVNAGDGGASAGVAAGGAGAALTVRAGDGGDGGAGSVAGAGGEIIFDGGDAGIDAGGGGSTGGGATLRGGTATAGMGGIALIAGGSGGLGAAVLGASASFNGGADTDGGDLTIRSGNAGGIGGGTAGAISILGGTPDPGVLGNQTLITGCPGGAADPFLPGGVGGPIEMSGGIGGAASALQAGGVGGRMDLAGGDGGAGTAAQAAGAGAEIEIVGGDAGADNGGGGAVGGAVTLLGGAGTGAGNGGIVEIAGGAAVGAGDAGGVEITGGPAAAGDDGIVSIGETDTSRVDVGAPTIVSTLVSQGVGILAGEIGVPFVVMRTIAAGAPGVADDVALYAADLPFGATVIDAWAIIGTAIGASTWEIRDAAGGAGNLLVASIATAAAGVNRATGATPTNTTGIAAGGSIYCRRSDRGTAGELFVLCLRNT